MKISYNIRPRRVGKSTICRDKFYKTGTMIIDIQNRRVPILTAKSYDKLSLNSYNLLEFENILLLRSLDSKYKKEVLIIDEYDFYPDEWKNKINEIITKFEHCFESIHIETTSARLYNPDVITMASRIRAYNIPKDCMFRLLRNRYKDQFNELCDHLMTHPKTEIITHEYIKSVKPVDYIFLNINPVSVSWLEDFITLSHVTKRWCNDNCYLKDGQYYYREYKEEECDTEYKPSPCPFCKCEMKVKHITFPDGRPSGYNVIGDHKQFCYMESGLTVAYAKIEDLKNAWEQK